MRHINNAISKANRMLGLIKRSFCYMDMDMFVHLYKTLVRPHLEYGNVIWHPHYKRQSCAVEKVQRRATKLVGCMKNLSYQERLQKLKLPALKYRRLRGDLIQVYKIFQGIDNTEFCNFFHLTLIDETRNVTNKLLIKYSRTNIRKNCFSNRIAPYWNMLPVHVKQANNINTFKSLLDQTEQISSLKFYFDE